MLEFFADNPWLIFILIYFLARIVGGKKKGQEKQKKQDRPRAQAQGRKPVQKTVFQELRDALEGLQTANTQQQQKPARAERPAPAAPALPPSTPAANDPFAFHSLTDARPQRVDYDQTPNAFGFREAIQESTDQAFHVGGFSSFHEAHGLSHDAKRARQAPAAPGQKKQLLDGVDDIRRGIIMSEILGRPVSMRGRR